MIVEKNVLFISLVIIIVQSPSWAQNDRSGKTFLTSSRWMLWHNYFSWPRYLRYWHINCCPRDEINGFVIKARTMQGRGGGDSTTSMTWPDQNTPWPLGLNCIDNGQNLSNGCWFYLFFIFTVKTLWWPSRIWKVPSSVHQSSSHLIKTIMYFL